MRHNTRTIRSYADEAMRTCTDPHPRAVADAIIAALPKSRYEEALRESLWLYVRSISFQGQGHPDDHSARALGRPHAEASEHTGGMGVARSLAWLRDRVSVAPGVYKFLGDCSAGDLDVMAQVRREHAKSNASAADRYDRFAHLMREAKVLRLADLPADVLGGES